MLRIVPALAVAFTLVACSQKPPADGATAATEVPPAQAPVTPPPPPADPMAVGSQDAKDDLYCAGIIFAANPSPPNALNPIDEAILRKAQVLGINLAESGINKLVAEKAVHATHSALVSDAYAAAAARDLDAGQPRITLDACNERAKALPPVQ